MKKILMVLMLAFSVNASQLAKTIGSGGDYPTLGSCVHANEGLSQDTLSISYVSAVVDSPFTIHSYASGKTILIAVGTAYRHHGYLDSAKTIIISNLLWGINCNSEGLKLKITGLQIKINSPTDDEKAAILCSASVDLSVDKCIIWNKVGNVWNDISIGIGTKFSLENSLIKISNSGFYATGKLGYRATAVALSYSVIGVFLYNNTFYNYRTALENVGGSGTYYVKNCGFDSCTADTSGGGFSSYTTNSTATPTFDGGVPFLLDSNDVAWKDNGSNLTADTGLVSITDITGKSRSSSWDIGASEYSSSGSPPDISSAAKTIDTIGKTFSRSHENAGGAAPAWSCSAIPRGYSFNTSTGVISGRPDTIHAQAIYTVIATNDDGSDTCYDTITSVVGVPILSGTRWTCRSANQDNVQAGIDSATTGETVYIPADTVTWYSRAGAGASSSEKAPLYINNKKIILMGSGETTLINNKLTNTNYNNHSILVTANTVAPRICYFLIRDTLSNGIIRVQKNANQTLAVDSLRIDHIDFEWRTKTNIGCQAVSLEGLFYCVIDHCTAKTFYPEGGGIFCQGNYNQGETNTPPDYIGRLSWNLPSPEGKNTKIYIENCSFDFTTCNYYANVMDGTGGVSYCFRYNTVTNTAVECHCACTAGERGARNWEVYNNTFISPTTQNFAIKMRAGSGIIANNIFTGDFDYTILLDNQRTDSATALHCGNGLDEWCNGGCDLDGNDSLHGYPCLDQIGVDSGDIGEQRLSPVYVWGNTMNGSPYDTVELNPAFDFTSQSEHIKKGRDYFQSAKSGYTAYTYPHPLTGETSSMSCSSISPTSGAAGIADTINGSGFQATQGNGYVKYSTALATVVSWSDTKITVTVPAVVGANKVFVVNNDFQVDSSKTFTASGAPVIDSLSPSSVTVGQLVRLYGTFAEGDTIYVDGARTLYNDSTTFLAFWAPEHAIGYVNVIVSRSGAQDTVSLKYITPNTRTWISLSSTDANDVSNYDGSGAILSSDTLVIDSSAVSWTLTDDLSVAIVRARSAYTGAISLGGKKLSTVNGCYLQHTGDAIINDTVSVSGNGSFYVAATVDSFSGTEGTVKLLGNKDTAMILKDISAAPVKNWVMANSVGDTTYLQTMSTAVYYHQWIMDSGVVKHIGSFGTYFVGDPDTTHPIVTSKGWFTSEGFRGPIINHSNSAVHKFYLPKMRMTGAMTFRFTPTIETDDTLIFTDSMTLLSFRYNGNPAVRQSMTVIDSSPYLFMGLKEFYGSDSTVCNLDLRRGYSIQYYGVNYLAPCRFNMNVSADSVLFDSTIIINGTFVCDSLTKFIYNDVTSRINMTNCGYGTTNGNTTVVLTYPAGCVATRRRGGGGLRLNGGFDLGL